MLGEPRRPRSSATMAAVRPPAGAGAGAGGGPRRYPTVQMAAVEAPRSSGHMLDELTLGFDIDADGVLELDCRPSPPRTSEEMSRPSTFEPPPAPPPARHTSGEMLAVARRSSAARAATMAAAAAPAVVVPPPVDAHDALVAFAGFGEPPTGLAGTPGYALRVIARKRALRVGRQVARNRKSQEVAIYEASLRSADDGAVRSGLLVIAIVAAMFLLVLGCAALVLAGVVPVAW